MRAPHVKSPPASLAIAFQTDSQDAEASGAVASGAVLVLVEDSGAEVEAAAAVVLGAGVLGAGVTGAGVTGAGVLVVSAVSTAQSALAISSATSVSWRRINRIFASTSLRTCALAEGIATISCRSDAMARMKKTILWWRVRSMVAR